MSAICARVILGRLTIVSGDLTQEVLSHLETLLQTLICVVARGSHTISELSDTRFWGGAMSFITVFT